MTDTAQTQLGGQPAAHEPLTSKEGWRRFVDTPDEPPSPVPPGRRAAMTDQEWRAPFLSDRCPTWIADLGGEESGDTGAQELHG